MSRLCWLIVLAVLLGGVPAAGAPAAAAAPAEADGELITVVTAEGRPLFATGMTVAPGDQFIDQGNDIWAVTAVEGGRAIAHRLAKVVGRPGAPELALLRRGAPRAARAAAGSQPFDVAIYYTHSDEAYIPSDGTESARDKGSIYYVGDRFAQALQQEGLRVANSPANHNPHDHGAYARSRRTAAGLLADAEPAALFDIHRNAAPAKEYRFGEGLSRVMIVIGRSNPAHEANLAFARLIKSEADQRYPGLVRGIFLGIGTYNQDLSARSLILEMGSQHVAREEAAAGAALLAGAVAPVLRALQEPGSPAAETESVAATRSIGRLLLVAVALGAGLLLLTTRGKRGRR